jgi:hypothetical protein
LLRFCNQKNLSAGLQKKNQLRFGARFEAEVPAAAGTDLYTGSTVIYRVEFICGELLTALSQRKKIDCDNKFAEI